MTSRRTLELARRHAREGIYELQKAVLEVLQDAQEKGEAGLNAITIARKLEIPYEPSHPAMRNAITSGIIASLMKRGKVEQLCVDHLWRLTK